jgi:hypothetical protein
MTDSYNFQSKRSIIRRALILNRLAQGPAVNVEIAFSLGCTTGALAPYLRHLVGNGEIVSKSALNQTCRQRLPDLYSVALGVRIPPMPEGAVLRMPDPDEDAPDVKITKIWAPINFQQQNPFSALGL